MLMLTLCLYYLHHQGYVADLRETVIQIILGLESSVSERAASPPPLSSEYDHPDKQAAVNALRSISNKWFRPSLCFFNLISKQYAGQIFESNYCTPGDSSQVQIHKDNFLHSHMFCWLTGSNKIGSIYEKEITIICNYRKRNHTDNSWCSWNYCWRFLLIVQFCLSFGRFQGPIRSRNYNYDPEWTEECPFNPINCCHYPRTPS